MPLKNVIDVDTLVEGLKWLKKHIFQRLLLNSLLAKDLKVNQVAMKSLFPLTHTQNEWCEELGLNSN